MRKLIGVAFVTLAVAIVASSGSVPAAQKDGDPKYSIKDVMVKGHKGGLLKKVQSGTASDAEAKTLLEMYQSLAKDKPPKGDADSWKKKTDALVEGAKLYVDGKKGDAATKLTGAANCAACHKAHKG